MKPQIITPPSGEELVVLSRDDYEALVAAVEDDESDIAIYDARKAELEAGRDARLPAEVGAAMLRGDSLLKGLRKWRNLTQQELAQKTGSGQGYISDLEAGRRKGARETMAVIAKALGIEENWLAD